MHGEIHLVSAVSTSIIILFSMIIISEVKILMRIEIELIFRQTPCQKLN